MRTCRWLTLKREVKAAHGIPAAGAKTTKALFVNRQSASNDCADFGEELATIVRLKLSVTLSFGAPFFLLLSSAVNRSCAQIKRAFLRVCIRLSLPGERSFSNGRENVS